MAYQKGESGSEEHKMKKGQTLNPNGRPKKFITTLKAEGYKLSEINDTIQVMLSMSLEELKESFVNPNATVLEKTIASAVKKSIEKGDLNSIETLLTRVFGSKQNLDLTSGGQPLQAPVINILPKTE